MIILNDIPFLSLTIMPTALLEIIRPERMNSEFDKHLVILVKEVAYQKEVGHHAARWSYYRNEVELLCVLDL